MAPSKASETLEKIKLLVFYILVRYNIEMEVQHIITEDFVSIEESQRVARNLLEKYETEITAQAFQDINGWNRPFETKLYQNAIDHYLRDIPTEIQAQYWAHGVTRGQVLDRLTATLNVLSNSGIKGDVGRLGGMYGGFMTQCDFLFLLEKDNPFPSGKPQKPDETGLFKINIGVLVINTKFYPLVDELRSMFPNRKIIKANELPEYLYR
jgi:hypothetical protein